MQQRIELEQDEAQVGADTQRGTHAERHTETHRERKREKERDRERDRERENTYHVYGIYIYDIICV